MASAERNRSAHRPDIDERVRSTEAEFSHPLVTERQDSVVVRSPRKLSVELWVILATWMVLAPFVASMFVGLAGFVVGGLAESITLIAVAGGLAILGSGASLVLGTLAVIAVVALLRRGWPSIIDTTGIRSLPLFRKDRFVEPRSVWVGGAIGGARHVVVRGATDVVALTVQADSKDWTTDQIVGFARLLGGQLGLPVTVDLDVDAWSRFERDPRYRALVRFTVRNTNSERRFADYYRIEPAPPADLHHTHQGIRWRSLTLDRRELTWARGSIHLAAIAGVSVRFSERHLVLQGGSRVSQTWAELILLAKNGKEYRLFEQAAHPGLVSVLLWLRNSIAEAASDVADHGSPEDVPEALRARPRSL